MLRKIVAFAFVGLLAVVAIVAYSYLRTPEPASGPIQSIPLATENNAAAAPTQLPAPTEEDLNAPTTTEEAPTDPADEQGTSPSAGSGPVRYKVTQADSEARFIIEEVLNGAPNTVIGATNQVAGEIAVDFNNPAGSQVGSILINARSLQTDNTFRNRAIANRILTTDRFEFIIFEPTEILGMPAAITLGEVYNLQIAGNLTVRDVTQPVTFDLAITPVTDTRLEGLAGTTILYRDFGLTIPEVRSVASVEDEVRLEFEFTAEGE